MINTCAYDMVQQTEFIKEYYDVFLQMKMDSDNMESLWRKRHSWGENG